MAHGELFHPVDSERSGPHAILRAGETRFFGRDEDAITFLREEVYGVSGQETQAVGFTILAEHLVAPGTERLFTRLKQAFPDLKVIHVVRDNYLDALVSREIAKHNVNGLAFTSESSGSEARPQISVTPEQARRLFDLMWEVDAFFGRFFAGSNYMRLWHDSLCNDYSGEIQRVFRFLGVAANGPTKMIKRPIVHKAPDVLCNYDELKSAFASTRFEAFFNSNPTNITFLSDSEMRTGPFSFELDASAAVKNKLSSNRRFVLMKGRNLIHEFRRVFEQVRPQKLFELGIKRGGSMALFNLAFRPHIHAAIELDPNPIPPLEEVADLAERDGRVMRGFFGVDQSDKKRLLEIVNDMFGPPKDRPLDMVIDDASHRLEPSTASFEVLFPCLRAGGCYALEDWGWAHWPGCQGDRGYLAAEPALTNLVFKLLIFHTACPRFVSKITVTPAVSFIERGPASLDPMSFRIDDYLVMRGKQITPI
jgi:hypothetical protein